MFCHSCGSEVPEKAKFCPKCGTAVVEKKVEKKIDKVYQGTPTEGLTQAANRFKEKTRNVVLVALVVCAVIIAGVQMFGGGNSSSGGSSSGGSYSSDIFDHDYEPPKVLDCLTCGGDGDCTTCNGYGTEEIYAGAGDYVTGTCRTCHGSRNCRTCGGSGKR